MDQNQIPIKPKIKIKFSNSLSSQQKQLKQSDSNSNEQIASIPSIDLTAKQTVDSNVKQTIDLTVKQSTDSTTNNSLDMTSTTAQDLAANQPTQSIKLKLSKKPSFANDVKIKLPTGLSRSNSSQSLNLMQKKKKKKNRPPRIPDSDEDETLNPVEEQLIFRLPSYSSSDIPSGTQSGSYCHSVIDAVDKIKELIKSRSADIQNRLGIEFRENRKALIIYTNADGVKIKLAAKLMDLPCIIESQRSFDRRQFHKIADICQMLEVQKYDFHRIGTTQNSVDQYLEKFFAQLTALQISQNISNSHEEFIYNSGITPPLKHCRVRRFRKRVNRRTVESIEREVARLLKEDQKAIEVVGSFIDAKEVEERFMQDADADGDAETQADAETEDVAVVEDGESDDEDDGTSVGDNLDKGQTEQTSDDDEDEDEGKAGGNNVVIEGVEGQVGGDADMEDIENEEDPELRQLLQQNKLLNEEMTDLNIKYDQKLAQKEEATNPILKKRFEDILVRLKDEIEKKTQVLGQVQRNIAEVRIRIEEDQDLDQDQDEMDEQDVDDNDEQIQESNDQVQQADGIQK